MYALNTATGTVLATEHRISAGALTPVVDKAGRVWAPDSATPSIFSPPKVDKSNNKTLWNTTGVLQIFGHPVDSYYDYLFACDTVPELAPNSVFTVRSCSAHRFPRLFVSCTLYVVIFTVVVNL